MQIIRDEVNKRTQISPWGKLGSPFINKLYLDAVIDIESVIKNSQTKMWKALKAKPEFRISLSETQTIREIRRIQNQSRNIAYRFSGFNEDVYDPVY